MPTCLLIDSADVLQCTMQAGNPFFQRCGRHNTDRARPWYTWCHCDSATAWPDRAHASGVSAGSSVRRSVSAAAPPVLPSAGTASPAAGSAANASTIAGRCSAPSVETSRANVQLAPASSSPSRYSGRGGRAAGGDCAKVGVSQEITGAACSWQAPSRPSQRPV